MDILKRLASWLDRPLFPWKSIVLGFNLSQYFFQSYLSWRQYRVLCGTVPPKALSAEISQETFDKSQAYGRAKAKFGFVSGLFSQVLDVGVLYYDVLPKLWNLTAGWPIGFGSYKWTGEIAHSLVFIFTFSFIQTLLGLPFSYYNTFVLEEKFGFNKQTFKLWVTDFLKSQALTIALGTPIGAAFLWIIKKTGDKFFYYIWIFMLVVQMFAITIFPSFIVPLFNKLSPLEPGSLKDSIEALAAKLKFPLHNLRVIDGSKRSAHSNAYFTGLPWKKEIVLFDTLIEKQEEQEVVAVLAHELGHWHMGHIPQQLGIAQVHLFAIFALFSAFINNKSLYDAFGFTNEKPIMIGFILFNDIFGPIESVMSLFMNILSRKFEYQADEFGAKLGYSAELARSLIKLNIQNLSAMDADWMYSAYHHSHPILTERLRALGWESTNKVGEKVDFGKDGVVKASGRDEL